MLRDLHFVPVFLKHAVQYFSPFLWMEPAPPQLCSTHHRQQQQQPILLLILSCFHYFFSVVLSLLPRSLLSLFCHRKLQSSAAFLLNLRSYKRYDAAPVTLVVTRQLTSSIFQACFATSGLDYSLNNFTACVSRVTEWFTLLLCISSFLFKLLNATWYDLHTAQWNRY